MPRRSRTPLGPILLLLPSSAAQDSGPRRSPEPIHLASTAPASDVRRASVGHSSPCVYCRFATSSITVAHGTTDRAISVLGNVATIELSKNATNLAIQVLIVDDDFEETGRRRGDSAGAQRLRPERTEHPHDADGSATAIGRADGRKEGPGADARSRRVPARRAGPADAVRRPGNRPTVTQSAALRRRRPYLSRPDSASPSPTATRTRLGEGSSATWSDSRPRCRRCPDRLRQGSLDHNVRYLPRAGQAGR